MTKATSRSPCDVRVSSCFSLFLLRAARVAIGEMVVGGRGLEESRTLSWKGGGEEEEGGREGGGRREGGREREGERGRERGREERGERERSGRRNTTNTPHPYQVQDPIIK